MKDTIKYAIGQLEENTFFAPGAVDKIKEIIKNYNSILLFYDKEAFKPCGAEAFFQALSEGFPIRKIPYSGKALPIEDIQKIYDDIKNIKNIDLIIAVGGGTIIDLTKICALTISNKLTGVDEVLTGKTFDNKIDLAFIPTTAGTGSEATTFAVVYKDKKKFSILSPTMLPRYTILDPHLLLSHQVLPGEQNLSALVAREPIGQKQLDRAVTRGYRLGTCDMHLGKAGIHPGLEHDARNQQRHGRQKPDHDRQRHAALSTASDTAANHPFTYNDGCAHGFIHCVNAAPP